MALVGQHFACNNKQHEKTTTTTTTAPGRTLQVIPRQSVAECRANTAGCYGGGATARPRPSTRSTIEKAQQHNMETYEKNTHMEHGVLPLSNAEVVTGIALYDAHSHSQVVVLAQH